MQAYSYIWPYKIRSPRTSGPGATRGLSDTGAELPHASLFSRGDWLRQCRALSGESTKRAVVSWNWDLPQDSSFL